MNDARRKRNLRKANGSPPGEPVRVGMEEGNGSAKRFAVPLGIAAAVLLLLLVNPWVEVSDDFRPWISYLFWIIAIALLVVLYMMARSDPESGTVEIEGPAFARFLFSNSRAGIFWLPIRLFLGFEWLEAGWHKLTGEGWVDGGVRARRLLGERGRRSRRQAGSPADQLRVVPRLPQLPDRRPPRDLVRLAHHASASWRSASA